MAKKLYHELRTGVIGAGSMGKNHIRLLNEISNLVAVVDTDEKQGLAVASKYGIPFFKDYYDIIGKVDAVSIVVPTLFHSKVSQDLMLNGINVLVEKPLADSVTAASSIVECSNEETVILGVGHVERYNPAVTAAKKFLVKAKEKILTLSAKRMSPYPSRITDVGVMMDLTIHDIDIISYFAASNPISVYATGKNYCNPSHEDFVNLIINYDNGVRGICQTSWLSPTSTRKLEIITPNNLIKLDFMSKNLHFISKKAPHVEESVPVGELEPLREELIDFLSSVSSKRQPLVTGQEGLNAVRIAQAGLKSIKEGIIVTL